MQLYWMSAEMSSPAMVMMKYQNLLRYLWRMPPPLLWPTMLYLSKQENKQLTSRAWHNVLPKKGEINKAFVMLYLYEKKQRGSSTRQTAGSAMNHLSECEMSAEWPFVESRSRSLPQWQYSISNESGYRPGSGGHSEFFTPPTPSLHFLPTPSLFAITGSPLDITRAPCLLSVAHPVTRQSAMNTETCYLNVIKCKYLAIFLLPRERAHVDMQITNKRPSWTTAEKSQQALRAGRLANTNQFHCVFVFGVSQSGMKPPPSGLLLLFGQCNPAKGSH